MVRRAFAAWNGADISIYREFYAPDVVAYGGELAAPEVVGSVTGPDALISVFETQRAAFERNELVAEAMLGEGDALVVPAIWRGIPRGGIGWVEQRLVVAYRFRDGRIAFNGWYSRIDDALNAVGLTRDARRFPP
jgi:ketosteroid isomerase-like protein